jgi:predicted small secreted protein
MIYRTKLTKNMKKNSFILFFLLMAAIILFAACNGNAGIGPHSTQEQNAAVEQQITATPTGKPAATSQAAGPIDQGELAFGQTYEGQITSRDGDRWTFFGSVGDQISIAVNGANRFDTVLDLFDENSILLMNDDDSGSGYNSLINGYTLPYSGDFTVIVSGYGGARGAYTISLTEGTAVVQSSIPVDMGVIEYGQEISGEIEDTPGHTYTFSGTAGDIVNISLTGGQGDTDTYLELYNASGTQVASDNDSGVGSAASIQNFTLPTTGTYTILARFFEGGAGGYTLTLDRGYMEIPANLPGECMTNAYDMGMLSYGGTSNTFTISQYGDRYLFNGEAGDQIFINMYGVADFAPYLALYDQACILIASDENSDGSNNARIAVTLSESQSYTIIATGINGETGDYIITLSEGEEMASDQSAPGFGAYDMGSLQTGETNSSFTISAAGDIYTFNSTSAVIISITVTSSEFSPIVELYDPEGILLASDGEARTGSTAAIQRFSIPAAGSFSIIIRGNEGSTGNYTISLSRP